MPSSHETSSPQKGRLTQPLALLIVFTAMLAVGISLLIIEPAASHLPPATPANLTAYPAIPAPSLDQADFTVTQPAQGTQKPLRYAPPSEDLVLRNQLSITQKVVFTRKDSTSTVTTALSATALLEPNLRDPSKVFISFTDFSIRVDSNGDSVALPAVNTLLEGIRLVVVFDPVTGFEADASLVTINPQVRRMLSLLVDVLRQAYPPLAAENVAPGSHWQREGQWKSSERGAVSTNMVQMVRYEEPDAYARLDTTTALELDGNIGRAAIKGSGEGKVTSTLDLAHGRVTASHGELRFEQNIHQGPEQVSQSLQLNFELQALSPLSLEEMF